MRDFTDEIFELETTSGYAMPGFEGFLQSPREGWLGETPSLNVSKGNLANAVAYNRKSAGLLGWGAYRSDIAQKVLGLSYSPDESAFAAAVALWQGARGLTADGKVGPGTWRAMKAILGLGKASTSPASPCQGTAPVSHQESVPPVQTFYACVNLGIQSAAAQTGIYVPPGFSSESQPELIVYLRGHSRYNTIDAYWKKPLFLLREALAQSGRNCILVAPTLGPKSQAGTLDQTGGFDRFIAGVMSVLKNNRIVSPNAKVGKIILACHSGGGKPMMNIAGLSDAHSGLVTECWGFDCMYGFARNDRRKVPDFWSDWARSIQAKLYVYFHHSTAHNSKTLACLTRGLPNVFVQPSANLGGDTHNKLVLPYWKERLASRPTVGFAPQCGKSKELEQELSDDKLRDAVDYNNSKGATIGWADYFDDIVAKVLQLNYTPVDWLFADLVADWQAANGLTPDGKLGPTTWAKMKALMAPAQKPATPAVPADKGDLGKFLAFLGYEVASKDFATVLITFQADMGLSRTGKMNPPTEEKIRLLRQQLQGANQKSNPIRRLSRFRLTNFYVVNETDYPTNPIVPVLNDDGSVLAGVNPKFFLSMSIEGTGRLRDGRLINVTGKRRNVSQITGYGSVLEAARGTRLTLTDTEIKKTGVRLNNGRVDSVLAFNLVSPAKTGKGYGTASRIAHDPFFTLAADVGAYPSSDSRFCKTGGLVPRGTKVFILEYVGRKLPDGRIHDGWFTVNDTGSAIFGAHFDVFTGSREWGKQFWKPPTGHIWFDASEQRCPPNYLYGLTEREIISSNCRR